MNENVHGMLSVYTLELCSSIYETHLYVPNKFCQESAITSGKYPRYINNKDNDYVVDGRLFNER